MQFEHIRKLAKNLYSNSNDFLKHSAEIFRTKSQLQKIILLIVTSIILSFLTVPLTNINLRNYKIGDIAANDIRSPMDITIEDKETTKTKQEEAAANVYPVYDYLTNQYDRIEMRITDAFNWAREELSKETNSLSKEKFEELLSINIDKKDYAVLVKNKFSQFIEKNIKNIINAALSSKIVTRDYKELEKAKGLTMRVYYFTEEDTTEFGKEVVATDLSRIQSFEDSLLIIQKLGNKNFRRQSKSVRNALLHISTQLMQPNLLFNKIETDQRRQIASFSITPVRLQIKKREVIVREGERVGKDHLVKFEALRSSKNFIRSIVRFTGLFFLIGLTSYVTFTFALMSVKKFEKDIKNLVFIATMSILFVILLKIFTYINEAIEIKSSIALSVYNYLIPVATIGMLVRALRNSETAIVCSGILAVLSSVLFNEDIAFAIYVFIGCISGAHFVAYCTQRSVLIKAGIKTGIVNMGAVLSMNLIGGENSIPNLIFGVSFGFISGLLSSIIATWSIPVMESIFGYATDMKLLELVNIEHPLLKEITLRAPGSYHHSIMVSSLAEAAARAIQANPVIAKVGAYFHDVGKVRIPQYYVENQFNWENKHDNISPRMSSIIIVSHVKEGLELANQHQLPNIISDIIIQHHGTSLIKYFYEKAKGASGDNNVNEIDYRYPGPKPQTREAGIIMLADAIEAASRTLKEPSVSQIQHMVEKLVNYFFSDGQLEECMLTLKDLHEISRSFVNVLAGGFHHRVDYPIQLTLYHKKDKKNGVASEKPPDKDKKDSDIYIKRIGLS